MFTIPSRSGLRVFFSLSLSFIPFFMANVVVVDNFSFEFLFFVQFGEHLFALDEYVKHWPNQCSWWCIGKGKLNACCWRGRKQVAWTIDRFAHITSTMHWISGFRLFVIVVSCHFSFLFFFFLFIPSISFGISHSIRFRWWVVDCWRWLLVTANDEFR